MTDTKERLLQTAAELFAKHGIDGVSTRDLVRASGVNLCSINYYFGTKQNLYDAVLDEMIEKISVFANAKQFPLENKKLKPLEEVVNLVGNMVDFLCSDEIPTYQAELLIKEIVQPTSSYNKLYRKVIEPLHKRITCLIMQITELSEQDAIIQTHCIMGQVVMFKVHKEALLRRMEIKTFDNSVIDLIKKQIISNCKIILERNKI